MNRADMHLVATALVVLAVTLAVLSDQAVEAIPEHDWDAFLAELLMGAPA